MHMLTHIPVEDGRFAMGSRSPSPLPDRSSCVTWGTQSPGSPWGISTPKAEREYELAHNLPSGSWPGRGASHSPSGWETGSPVGCAYDPPGHRAVYGSYCEDGSSSLEECTGCGFEEPFARSLDNGDPYCKDCWCATGVWRQAASGVRDGRKALSRLPASTTAKGCLSPQPPS